MTKVKRSLFVVLVVFGLLIAFSGAALAGGVWTKGVTPVYELPSVDLPAYGDDGLALTIPAMVEVIAIDMKSDFVQIGTSTAYTDTLAGKWVSMADLTSVKPELVKAKELQEKLKGLKLGDITIFELIEYLKMSWNPAPAPAAIPATVAQPVSVAPVASVPSTNVAVQPAPAISAPSAPAACVDKGDRWSGLGGKNLIVPVGCEVWISSDPATLTVNGASVKYDSRFTFVVTGEKNPTEIAVAGPHGPENTHYSIGSVGKVDISIRDGAPINTWLRGGKIVDRPETVR